MYENCSNFLIGVTSFSLPSNIFGIYISAAGKLWDDTGAIAPQASFYISRVVIETAIIFLTLSPWPSFSLPILCTWVELRHRREIFRFYHTPALACHQHKGSRYPPFACFFIHTGTRMTLTHRLSISTFRVFFYTQRHSDVTSALGS